MAGSTPSIVEVAQLAGVSIATVSNVLNGTKPVSPKTRVRVEAAVLELGYRVNAFGRSLRRGKSGMVLVLVPDFSNPFHGEIISGIASATRERGYNLLLADAGELWTRGEIELEAVYSRLTDGVISLAPMPGDKELSRLIPDLPWVACSEFLPDLHVPFVSVDHCKGAADAVQYLINQGHRRIALINSDEHLLYARQRRLGYEEALRRNGIEVDPELILCTGLRGTDYAHGSQAAANLLALDRQPTAVFAVSDRLAIGAMKTFKRSGRRIPADIAVIGFDNLPIGEFAEPSLSTVSQPARALGIAATEMLLERVAGGEPASRTLRHELILRESA